MTIAVLLRVMVGLAVIVVSLVVVAWLAAGLSSERRDTSDQLTKRGRR